MSHSFNEKTDRCINCDVPRSHCHDEANAAANWRRKAEQLWDLVYHLAPCVPRYAPALYEKVQAILDDGIAWLDGKIIECDGDE